MKGWLVAGLDLALDTIKWVWKQACSMLEAALEFVRDIFQGFSACFRYHRQRISVEVNDNKVEIKRDEFFVGAEVNQNREIGPLERNLSGPVFIDGESVQSCHSPNQPSKSVQQEAMTALREGLSDQDKNKITFCKDFFGILEACVKQDPQHESMAKTEQKLLNLMSSDAGQDLLGNFNGLGLISSSLA